MNRFKRLVDEALAVAAVTPVKTPPRVPRARGGAGKGASKALLEEPLRVDRTGSDGGLSLVRSRMPGANALEAAYGARLDHMKSLGQIRAWWWQPMSLRLTFLEDGRGDFYRPDFLVEAEDRELQIHETKGFMQDDARTKLKVAAAIYPFRFFLAERKAGEWKLTPFLAALP